MRQQNNLYPFVAVILLICIFGLYAGSESYIPSLNPLWTYAGRYFGPGIVATGNIDATTATVTSQYSLNAVARASTSYATTAANALLLNASTAVIGGGAAQSGYELTVNGAGAFGGNVTHISADGTTAGDIRIATAATGSNPRFQISSVGEDNQTISFDSYTSGGGWYSSDIGTNFKISKAADAVYYSYDSGVTPGNSISWNNSAFMDLTNGNWTFSSNIQAASAVFTVGTQSPYYTVSSTKNIKRNITDKEGKPVTEFTRKDRPVIRKYQMNPSIVEPKERDFEDIKDASGTIIKSRWSQFVDAFEEWENVTSKSNYYEKQREGFIVEELPEFLLGDNEDTWDMQAMIVYQEKRIQALEDEVSDLITRIKVLESK